VAQVHEYSGSLIPATNSRWGIVRDVLNAIVLMAGAAYSLQYLFKYFNKITALECGHKSFNLIFLENLLPLSYLDIRKRKKLWLIGFLK